MKSSVRTSIVVLLITILVVGTISAIMFLVATDAQAQDLNVSVKGLDQVETYLVKSALTAHKLTLSTPVTIEKSIVKRDWNGQLKEFAAIKVTIKVADGEFVGEVDNRDYPQLSGEEYYGLLKLALQHACQGPENFRRSVKLDVLYDEIRSEITKRSQEHGYEVLFHRPTESPNAFFYIDDVWCNVNYSSESGVPVYSMVNKNRSLQVVDGGLDAIFSSIQKNSALVRVLYTSERFTARRCFFTP